MRKGGREEESDKRERKEGRKGVRERGRGRRGGKKETKIKKSTDTINRNNCNMLWDVCSPPIYIVHLWDVCSPPIYMYIVHVYTTILTLNLQIGRPLTGISESEFDQ